MSPIMLDLTSDFDPAKRPAPSSQRTLLLAATMAIFLLAGASALVAARDLHVLLELARAAR